MNDLFDAQEIDLMEASVLDDLSLEDLQEYRDRITKTLKEIRRQEQLWKQRTVILLDMKEEVVGGRRRLVCKIPKYTYCTQSGSSFGGNLLRHPE